MLTSDFYFDLPENLVAQYPSATRGADKLMLLERFSGKVSHYSMNDLPHLVSDNTLMIFNNSKVRRARVYGVKESTGREVEFVFLNTVGNDFCTWNTLVKSAKKQKPGMRYSFPDGSIATIVADNEKVGTEFRLLHFDFPVMESWFEKNGHIPLPPYIKRNDETLDSERYQTVYAKIPGSAACPTAGLHFTNEMISSLSARGVDIAYVTLHVGLGTFLPVRETNIENHKMHSEFYTVPSETAFKVNEAKKARKKILAVGTTSCRTLESACNSSGVLQAGSNSTNIFMYPPYKFKIVDELFTNFHTPESTLLMLVSAFAGKENIFAAYKQAVQDGYRFFSYGDAMYIRS